MQIIHNAYMAKMMSNEVDESLSLLKQTLTTFLPDPNPQVATHVSHRSLLRPNVTSVSATEAWVDVMLRQYYGIVGGHHAWAWWLWRYVSRIISLKLWADLRRNSEDQHGTM